MTATVPKSTDHTLPERSHSAETDRPNNRSRLWAMRLAAVVLSLSVFAIFEGVCVLLDWGRPTNFADPFVGFSEIHPLFVLNRSPAQGSTNDGSTAARYVIPPPRQKFFAPESFPAQKPPKSFRIFCLGGSTVQGRPYSKETSFTTWLELGLHAADDSRNWDVVNCGGVSYASYRLVPILRECLDYQPDLFILCTGHNEFLEERTYEHIKNAPSWQRLPHESLSRLRSYTLFRHALLQLADQKTAPTGDRPQLKSEVDARLDYRNGLKKYHRDDERREKVIAHFEHNLRRMIAMAQRAEVPIILIRPPSNLSDSPPFKSQHRDGLSATEHRRWTQLMQQARQRFHDDLPAAVQLLQRALKIDERYAATWYQLGKCFEALAQWDAAREAFLRAREEDVCPLRILRPMEVAIDEVTSETQTPLIDAHRLLEQHCPHGILSDHMLVDHVHPSFRSHQLIASAIVDEMIVNEWLTAAADWQWRRKQAYRQHVDSLDDMYYLKGERTLRAVEGWTQGRADTRGGNSPNPENKK